MKKSLISAALFVFLINILPGCKTEIVDYNGRDADTAIAETDIDKPENPSADKDLLNPSPDKDTPQQPDEDIKKAECGNNIPEEGEACETEDSKECATISSSYESGTAPCKSDCSGWDTSGCVKKADVTEYCGDSIINGEEKCDGDSKKCTDIDSAQFQSGNAPCKSDCSGWDNTSCEKKPVITDEPTGKINTVAIQTSYIFDASRMSESGYLTYKTNYFQKSPAGFSGTVDGTAFPYTQESFEPWTGSIYDEVKKQLQVLMGSVKISGMTPVKKEISVQLYLKTESLAKKTYSADWTTNDADEAKIVVFKEYQPSTYCVLAVAAKGEVTIEDAPAPDYMEVDVQENIIISGSEINLYKPNNMPYENKDITSLITSFGLTVCE